jgi:putative ABC transport system substrate-binding protein
MKRREFIAFLGSATVCPLTASAQQANHILRVGILLGLPETDPEGQARFKAFRDGLRKLGWVDGRNVEIVPRWASSDTLLQSGAAELVGLKSDVLVAAANPAMIALHRATTSIPIVFAQVSDPVGFVKSLAQPGGNMTGFTNLPDEIAAKWVGLLRDIGGNIKTVGVLYDPNNPSWHGFMRELQSAAGKSGLQVKPAAVSNELDLDRAFDELMVNPAIGMIIFPSPATTRLRTKIPNAAALNHIPAIYPFRFFAEDGGLAYYGVDNIDLYRRAAGYVSRILKGERPATLPVQNPTKFEFVINLRTAKALRIAVPQALLIEADDVIE